MIEHDPGYCYDLENCEGHELQTIQFVKKRMAEPDENCEPDRLITVHDGTTNEEVLEVLIDRMKILQENRPGRENAIIIAKLEESLMWLERRTEDRKARGVEGTVNP